MSKKAKSSQIKQNPSSPALGLSQARDEMTEIDLSKIKVDMYQKFLDGERSIPMSSILNESISEFDYPEAQKSGKEQENAGAQQSQISDAPS